jgi:Sulfotransferase family
MALVPAGETGQPELQSVAASQSERRDGKIYRLSARGHALGSQIEFAVERPSLLPSAEGSLKWRASLTQGGKLVPCQLNSWLLSVRFCSASATFPPIFHVRHRDRSMKKRRPYRNKYVLPLLAVIVRRPLVNLLHISKTGGTALRAGLGMEKHDVTWTPSHILHFRQHDMRLADIPRGQKVVFCVRNPVERFVSAFYSRLRRGRTGSNARQPGEAEAFERFRTPNALAVALSSHDATERSLAEAAMRSIRHVREGLTFWLTHPDELRDRSLDILHVCRQETLEEDFAWLKSFLNLPSDHALPESTYAAHKLPAEFDRRLTPEATANISQWYAPDFAIIESCEPFFLTRKVKQGSTGLQRDVARLTTRGM